MIQISQAPGCAVVFSFSLPNFVSIFLDCLPALWIFGVLQARRLEWVAFPFSRVSSQPRDQSQVCRMQADSLAAELPGKPWQPYRNHLISSHSCTRSHLCSKPRAVTHTHTHTHTEVCFFSWTPTDSHCRKLIIRLWWGGQPSTRLKSMLQLPVFRWRILGDI